MTAETAVALVTGARKGLGRAVAEKLLADGYRVLGCSREPTDLAHERYVHVRADVTEEEDVKRLLAEVRTRFGRLDAAINNVGAASMNHFLLTPASTLDRLFAENVRSAFLVSRESAKLMQKRKFGRIVNLTTVAVPLKLEGEAVYAASKGAVEELTRVLARELGGLGITVNAIGPAPTETDLTKSVPRKKIEEIVERLAIKRLGQPRDVCDLVSFLVRPECDYLTGQVIYLGGP